MFADRCLGEDLPSKKKYKRFAQTPNETRPTPIFRQIEFAIGQPIYYLRINAKNQTEALH